MSMPEYQPVSVLRRLGSIAIDGFALVLVCFAAMVALFIEDLNPNSARSSTATSIWVILIGMILITLTYAAFELGMKGSLGKRVCGIRMISEIQRGKGAYLIRGAAKWIPVFSLLYFVPLAYAMSIIDRTISRWTRTDDLIGIGLFVLVCLMVWDLVLFCLGRPLVHERLSRVMLVYCSSKPGQEPRGFEVIVGKKDQ